MSPYHLLSFTQHYQGIYHELSGDPFSGIHTHQSDWPDAVYFARRFLKPALRLQSLLHFKSHYSPAELLGADSTPHTEIPLDFKSVALTSYAP